MKTTYLALLTFTDLGIRNLGQSAHRAAAWRQRAEADGVKVLAQLWTTGAYDGVLLLEAASEQPILHALAQLATQGNVRTHSLRALGADEFQAIAPR
jgi:uncharacterized protein with GYD domain